MKHIITTLLIFITLLQGGFTDAVWSLCGVIVVLFLLLRAKKMPPKPVLILIFLLTAVYIFSAVVHGLPFESLAAVSRIMVAVLFLFAFCNIEADITETVFITGMVVALIGFATLCGLFHWEGAVVSNRLQSVFQYANAAGFFIGIAAFLTRTDAERSELALILETALLLTQSVGALIVYGAGLAFQERLRVKPAMTERDAYAKRGAYACSKDLSRNHCAATSVPLCDSPKPRHCGLDPQSPTSPNYTNEPLRILCGFAVSAFAAATVYAILLFSPIPQLGLLPPILLFVLRKKIPAWITRMIQQRWFNLLGGGVCLLAVSSVIFIRGFRPLATYLERLVHIWDGLRVISKEPLGIGPGAWQFELFAHQSSLYSVTRIHSEYIAVGVDAGFLAVVIILFAIIYWLHPQFLSNVAIFQKRLRVKPAMTERDATERGVYATRNSKAICILMILLASTMDIPFSFLSITLVTMWFVALTLPKFERMPTPTRAFFLLPLALFLIVFAQSAIKNQAAWVALTDPPRAAEILSRLPIQNDTDAALTRISIYLYEEQHDLLDAVFESMYNPNTVAHAQRTRSLIRRGLYEEAAINAIAAIESGPHRRVTADALLEQILPNLNELLAEEYQRKADSLIPEVNPLRKYIQAIKGETEP